MAGDPAAGRLRRYLGLRPCLTGPRAFALGHTTLLSIVPAQQRAATTQTPRRPIGAGGERGASGRLGVRDHHTTHALFALKVQRKVSNGVAGLAAGGSSLDRQKSRPIRALQPCRSMAQRWAQNACWRSRQRKPELRIPNAAAQTRIVSVARIWLDPRKSVRPFKGIFCGDISEFESYMPSHAVGLSQCAARAIVIHREW